MSQRIFHILIAEDMETTVDLMKYYLNKEFSNLDISVVALRILLFLTKSFAPETNTYYPSAMIWQLSISICLIIFLKYPIHTKMPVNTLLTPLSKKNLIFLL